MKNLFLLLISLSLVSCAENQSKETAADVDQAQGEMEADVQHSDAEKEAEKNHDQDAIDPNQTEFGADFEIKNLKSNADMLTLYESMDKGDTLAVQYKAEINSVCQKKGCWVRLKLDEEDESFIKFKDYAFFLPKDAAGRGAVVQGKAYLKEVSVDHLKHFAEDAGQSKEEIAKITKPELTYAFMAEGVKLDSK
ncbi:MAG: DUF4920 domain-containing protein [Psychroflexus sp.]